MEDLVEVMVDRKVLDSFKRRALKVYPREIFEQVVGRISGTQAGLRRGSLPSAIWST